jgi:hypothetical protein
MGGVRPHRCLCTGKAMRQIGNDICIVHAHVMSNITGYANSGAQRCGCGLAAPHASLAA